MVKSQKNILPAQAVRVNGSLWLEYEGRRFFGPGPVQLLEYIEETGSINKAAKEMGMSYSKAWSIVNNLNSSSTKPLVITATGGEKGGGSTISAEAKQLIAYYRQLRARFKKFLEQESNQFPKIHPQ
jgi:molybdate transport system regulatory protein